MATSSFHVILPLLALCCATLLGRVASAQDELSRSAGTRYAMIIIGLAGDAEHRAQFQNIELSWTKWLREESHLAAENILVLSGRAGVAASANQQDDQNPPRTAATTESIRIQIAAINKRLQENDSLWVFFLGHANYDDEHAFFHLPGPDINEDDVAELFAETKCREQVFWLTHACSGWFLKSLSQAGRIVITATAADREYNETEFPAALATVFAVQPDKLDSNEDGQVSVSELFVKTTAAVAACFAVDRRASTEHAQLDDNGDGAGTETDKLVTLEESDGEPVVPVTGRVKAPDGQLAASTFLPSKLPSRPSKLPSERTEDKPSPRD